MPKKCSLFLLCSSLWLFSAPLLAIDKTFFVEIPLSCGNVEWNEQSSESESNYILTSAVFQTLLRMGQDGRLHPYLAAHWEVRSPQLIKFKLKENIYFSDGQRVQSSDVKASFERIRRTTDFTKTILSSINQVEIIDHLHFNLSLREPDPLILQKISLFFRIYNLRNLHQIQKINKPRHNQLMTSNPTTEIPLTGTGPWRYLGFHHDHHRFESIKQSPKQKQNGTLKLEVYCGAQGVAIDERANKDRGDRILIEDLGGLRHLRSRQKFQFTTLETLSSAQTFGVFNLLSDNEALKDVNIRKAINYSMNREVFKRLVLKNKGIMRPGLSLANEVGSVKKPLYPYSPETAKKIVDDWKHQHDQKQIVIRLGLQSQEEETLSFLDQLSHSLSQIGIEVSINPAYSIEKHRQFKKSIDVIFGSDPSPYLHVDFFLRNFYFPRSAFYVGAPIGLQKKIHVIRKLKTGDHSLDEYRDVDRFLYSEFMGIPGFQQIRIRAYSGPLRDIAEQGSLLNFSLLHPGEVK